MNSEEKMALFYGIMLGDGCLSHYFSNGREYFTISITGHFPEDNPFYEKVLKPLLKCLGRKSVSIKRRKDCNAIEINFPDERLFKKLNSLGFPIGKKGNKICIPNLFFKKGLVKYVVSGYFATDGSLVLTKNPNKFYPRIGGCGISRNLIIQTTEFLKSCGLKGTKYLAKRKKKLGDFPNRKPIFRYQFNGKKNLLLFQEVIGFINPKNQEKFQRFLKYDLKYDCAIRGISFKKQNFMRDNVKL